MKNLKKTPFKDIIMNLKKALNKLAQAKEIPENFPGDEFQPRSPKDPSGPIITDFDACIKQAYKDKRNCEKACEDANDMSIWDWIWKIAFWEIEYFHPDKSPEKEKFCKCGCNCQECEDIKVCKENSGWPQNVALMEYAECRRNHDKNWIPGTTCQETCQSQVVIHV